METRTKVIIGVIFAVVIGVVIALSVIVAPESSDDGSPNTTDSVGPTTEIPTTTELTQTPVEPTTVAPTTDCMLNIPQGLLMGRKITALNKTCEYLGLPYAQPPVGNLRWKAPVIETLPQWSEPRNATMFANNCLNTEYRTNTTSDIYNYSEDCLYLNVITPDMTQQTEPLPVYVFLHGGAFQTGGAMYWNIDNSVFANDQKIITVNLNYRINVMGFAAVDDDFLGKPTVGNFGLMDQYAAMEWIKNNIRYFGGDPDRITLSGESAGAESMISHFNWKESREAHPVQGGVILSNVWALPYEPVPDAKVMLKKLANYNGCCDACNTTKWINDATVDMDCLRAVDGQTLMNTPGIWPITWESQLEDLSRLIQIWGPCVDGSIVKGSPIEEFVENVKAGNVPPLLTGTAQDEGVSLVRAGITQPFHSPNEIAARVAIDGLFYPHGEEINAFYECNRGDPCKKDSRELFYPIIRDYAFACAMRYALKFSTANNWAYWFSRPSMVPRPESIQQPYIGCDTEYACHADTKQFVFGTGEVAQYYENKNDNDWSHLDDGYTSRFTHPNQMEPADVELSKKFRQWVGNFVRGQDPGQDWPKFDSVEGTFMYQEVLKDGSWRVSEDVNKDACELWDGIDNYGHF